MVLTFGQSIEHHFVGMQWKSCPLCMIRHEGLQLCFGSLNWWIESLQSLVTRGFPMARFGKTPSLHAFLGDILQVKSIQRILQDPLEMVQPSDPSISRPISLRKTCAVLPGISCLDWHAIGGELMILDGSNLIVICLGGWKSMKTS